MVKTKWGLIKIGWRRSVTVLDWADTSFRGILTSDEVTKDNCTIHAHSTGKVIEYLKLLKEHLKYITSGVEVRSSNVKNL